MYCVFKGTIIICPASHVRLSELSLKQQREKYIKTLPNFFTDLHCLIGQNSQTKGLIKELNEAVKPAEYHPGKKAAIHCVVAT